MLYRCPGDRAPAAAIVLGTQFARQRRPACYRPGASAKGVNSASRGSVPAADAGPAVPVGHVVREVTAWLDCAFLVHALAVPAIGAVKTGTASPVRVRAEYALRRYLVASAARTATVSAAKVATPRRTPHTLEFVGRPSEDHAA